MFFQALSRENRLRINHFYEVLGLDTACEIERASAQGKFIDIFSKKARTQRRKV
jgi:hypothetical protein